MLTTLSVLSILSGIFLMVFLCYKKINTIPATLIAAMVVGLLSQMDPGNIINAYLTGASNAIMNFFLLVGLGVTFGYVMESAGSAASIIHSVTSVCKDKYLLHALMFVQAVVCAYTNMGLAIVFMMMPLFLQALKKADLPRRFLAPCIWAGFLGYVGCTFPGNPGSINVLPTTLLGTTTMAAPFMTIVCWILGIVLTHGYMEWNFRKARKNNEGFQALPQDTEIMNQQTEGKVQNLMPLWKAIAPVMLIFILLNLLKLNTYLSFVITIIFSFILYWNIISGSKIEVLNNGFSRISSIIPICAAVAFGTVIKSTAGYEAIQNYATTIGGGNVYLSTFIGSNIVTAALASGSGSIAMCTEVFGVPAILGGANPEAIHRLLVICSQAFDSLPHAGFVAATIGICNSSYKESYGKMFVTSCIIPFILAIVATIMAIMFY